MLETPAADELIARASRLTGEQIANLAASTRRTIGRGLRAYPGIRSKPLKTANGAADAALKQADLETEMRAKVILLNDAVLSASVAAAKRHGRDTSGVQDAWRRFERAVDSGDSRKRQEAFRSAKKAFRRGIGPKLTRQWPMASVGATWALLALLTWDQAASEGSYTIQDRDTLTKPWTT